MLDAKNLKKGDFIRCIDTEGAGWCVLTWGELYEVEWTYPGIDTVKVKGIPGTLRLDRFEFPKKTPTHIPLYSEEQAIAFLKERGYSVSKTF